MSDNIEGRSVAAAPPIVTMEMDVSGR